MQEIMQGRNIKSHFNDVSKDTKNVEISGNSVEDFRNLSQFV